MKEQAWALAPYVLVKGAQREIDFCVAAFDAVVTDSATATGRIMHAELRFHGAWLVVADLPDGHDAAEPARSPIFLYLHVDAVDVSFGRAIAAGATAKEEPQDTPYGHRRCAFIDPLGVLWYLTAPIPGEEVHGRDPR